MSSATEIVAAVERLRFGEFVTLRTALDELEEKIWDRESGKLASKLRQRKLTDAKIDAAVIKWRRQGHNS